MVKNGSEVRRFKNDKNSALNIVGRLVEKHDKLILSLQREMGDDHQNLDQTSAGKALNVEINAQKEQYEKRLKEQEDEMKTALKENDMKYAQELLDAQDKINSDMKRKSFRHPDHLFLQQRRFEGTDAERSQASKIIKRSSRYQTSNSSKRKTSKSGKRTSRWRK